MFSFLTDSLRDAYGLHTKTVCEAQVFYTGLALDGCGLPLYHFGMNALTRYRMRAGLSQAQLASLTGTTQPTIQRFEGGKRKLSREWAVKIAPHVRTFPEFLLFEDRTVPIVGFVGASAEAHYYTDAGEIGRARMPATGSEDTVAVEIKGDSLGAPFDGWIVYYDERREPPTSDLLGLLCVVGLVDGQILIKKLMPGRTLDRFDLWPSYGAPMLDQEVGWAARVLGVLPPWYAIVENEPAEQPRRTGRRIRHKGRDAKPKKTTGRRRS